MTTQFELAQQAANAAYDMTMFSTGDEAQAASDYQDVMSAYHKRIVMVQHDGGAQEVHPDWIVGPAATNDEAALLADAMINMYRAMSDGQPDGIVEHDDTQAGAWK